MTIPPPAPPLKFFALCEGQRISAKRPQQASSKKPHLGRKSRTLVNRPRSVARVVGVTKLQPEGIEPRSTKLTGTLTQRANHSDTYLVSYWSGVWAARPPLPADEADAFLRSYTKTIDSTTMPPPDLEAVLSSIRSSNNSTPGPDGIPFAAWRAAPDLSAPVLGFNHGFLFLIPKKETGLVADTRPISVTNTDNRLLASTVARAIMHAVSAFLDPAQKGFLASTSGHSLTEDLNRFFYQGVVDNVQRFAFLLDTAKAFPLTTLGSSKSFRRQPSPAGFNALSVAPSMMLKWPRSLGVPPPATFPSRGGSSKVAPFPRSSSSFLTTPFSLLSALALFPTFPRPTPKTQSVPHGPPLIYLLHRPPTAPIPSAPPLLLFRPPPFTPLLVQPSTTAMTTPLSTLPSSSSRAKPRSPMAHPALLLRDFIPPFV